MSKLDRELSEAVRAVGEEARRGMRRHPDREVLLAYDAEELEGREIEQVREHLAVCRTCAEAVLELAELPRVEELAEEEQLRPAEREALRSAVEARLDEAAAEDAAAAVIPLRSPRRNRRGSQAWARGAVAALLLLCAILSLYSWSLQRRMARPRANALVVDLVPERSGTRGEETRVEVPTAMEALVFVLNLADLRSFPDYRVEVREGSSEGKLRWLVEGIVRGPRGNFSISVPRGALRDGAYWIGVVGAGPSGETPLASYRVRLEGLS